MLKEFEDLHPGPVAARCPLCGADGLRRILRLHDVPVLCNQLWPDAAAARAAANADLHLAVCRDCTLISNCSFRDDLVDYAPGYENALHFSPRFRAFAAALCEELVARYDLAGRDVVEIGCGDGHVLELMVQAGVRSATGFDPSATETATPFTATPGVEIVPEYFRADQLDRPCDFVLCRHVLEHLADPWSVLRAVRAAVGRRDCPVYFEVPNGQWMLESCSTWDAIYEHVTYWTPASLETLFRRVGFAPLAIRAGYDGQFLMIEARPAPPEPDFLPSAEARRETAGACRRFAATAEAMVSTWRGRLAALGDDGKRAVIWGAGSKGITFANAVAGRRNGLVALVDINVRKHGRFVPGVALPVTAPSALATLDPDLVMISNEVYANEIRRTVDQHGLSPEFAVIAG